jgi:transcriptional regulator with XRE-family HTH domain
MNIGQRIKERRLELGMTADELGAVINKSRATIYRYENGDVENMPTPILEPLAAALKTTPAELMGWEPEPASLGTTLYIEEYRNKLFVEEIMEYIKKLNDDGKAEAVERVKELTFNPRYAVMAEPLLNAAHERTDIKVTEEMKKHDDDIMDDENF